MGLYETTFIARQDLSTTQVEALTEKFTTLITENNGVVEKVEQAGLRSLAYEIKKNRKGHYVLLNITAPSAAIVELERIMGINEDILRFLTVRVEEHEKGLSALSRASRSGRDEGDDTNRSESSGDDKENPRYRERRNYNDNDNEKRGSY